jgi:predicted amidohydrolase
MTSRVLRPTPVFSARWVSCLVMVLTMLVSITTLSARGASENDGVLAVGAVQFAVSEEIYAGTREFKDAVNASLDRMERKAEIEAPGRRIDLAVFPEYTSAFLALSYLDADKRSALAGDPAAIRQLKRTTVIRALKAAEQKTMSLWSEIAADRGYAVLAGSALVVGPEGGIRNRALLFDRNGKLQWTQDKSFPGAPESELLDLAAGSVEDAEPFVVDGWDIVTTICRDTYNEVWEEVLPPADL